MRSEGPQWSGWPFTSVVWILACAALARAATNSVSTGPESDTNALSGFRLQSGFRLELVASEPMIGSPSAIAFDENGRMYVAEMSRLPGEPQAVPSPGRIRLLEKPNDKGKYGTSTVFAEDLTWPSAVICYGGGVFVGAMGEVVYLKDTDSDGVSDVRRVVLSGFGGTNTPNSDLLLNNFAWGLDNRIHGATAGLGGSVTTQGGEPVLLDDSDFSFDPRTLAIVREAGSGRTGLSFDSAGRKFISGPQRPLQFVMSEARYWRRNPFYVKASPFVDVVIPGAPIYRLPIGEETHHLATASSTNTVLAMLKSASGMTVYRGNAFPTNYLDNVFICDDAAKVIHRVVLMDRGLEVAAAKVSQEQHTEFLLCTNADFRPVQLANAPDGALYVVDAQDGERGRIYRIVPESSSNPKPPQLGTANTLELVSALGSANGWHRDTALRLLYEKRETSAAPLLSNMVSSARFPLARVHALRALAGCGFLREAHVLKALRDPDARVRTQALLAAEALSFSGGLSQAVWAQMRPMVSDPSPRVRHQVAFTAGAFRRDDKGLLLAQVLSREPGSPWLQDAVLSSLGEGAGQLFLTLAGDARFRSDPVGLALLRRLATMIGVKGRGDEVGQVLEFLGRPKLDVRQVFPIMQALGEGLRQTRSSLALIDTQGVLRPLFEGAMITAIDGTLAESLRVDAVRVIGVSPYTYPDTSDWLLLMTSPHPLATLRSTAVATLTRYDDPRVLPALLERWGGFPTALRRQATEQLLSRPSRVPGVLAALERGTIPARDLLAPTLNFIRSYPDPTVNQRALTVFGPVPEVSSEQLATLRSAVRMGGSAGRGRELFRLRCAECHETRSTPNRFMGPNLGAAKARGKEQLVSDIVDPNKEIDPRYRTWVFETQEAEILVGVKADENPSSVTLLQARANASVWHAAAIASMRSETWSLMPSALELGISSQDLADLLEFLVNPQE